jgi:hypothetical protein
VLLTCPAFATAKLLQSSNISQLNGAISALGAIDYPPVSAVVSAYPDSSIKVCEMQCLCSAMHMTWFIFVFRCLLWGLAI